MADRTSTKQRLAELTEAYRATFLHPNSPELLPLARKVMEDLRRVCRMDQQTVHMDRGGRIDPCAMAFNEGKRFVYLRIQQCLALEPAKLMRMIEAAAAEDADA